MYSIDTDGKNCGHAPLFSSSVARFGVFLYAGRYNFIGRAGVDDEANTIADKFSPFTLQSTLYMKKDDQVQLGIDLMSLISRVSC
jgi:hypothetical protein